ncbi:hypothetical protein E1162_06215 [Rhodobacteraceae bacterium RKSG542]|uniref:type III toxin-antitoxin system TenpIN family toxin n=1 Tax=Pseudovibrio flavus TaxID=2529854 RepID=UPI0012BB7968|nr:hypothetical protein [Pseudovibrio flavus]MTI16828.1 hypothetical protein [Pseudovibrio flavus]
MKLIKLDPSFYIDNPTVLEALDFNKITGTWDASKVRGHGIVTVAINGLTFAIPARSHIKHAASFILEVNRNDRAVKGMGLDFSKALLIKDPNHVTSAPFVLKSKQAGRKLVGKEKHVTDKFEKYVKKYVESIKKNDNNVLGNPEYRFTTLINYHAELGISEQDH